MILSDISQRRILVDNNNEVKRIKGLALESRLIFQSYKIEKNLYLITLTNTRVGDYFTTNSILAPGLAQKEKDDIKKIVNKYEGKIINDKTKKYSNIE